VKDPVELLIALKAISRNINSLSADPTRYELDPDAIADLNLARQSIDKLINRVERLVN
jgi:hypothetical protein